MQPRLFHIFRNTPFGRETLLQSIYFCKATGERLYIYIPTKKQFMLYVGSKAIQVGLDSSYLSDPGTAEDHCRQILDYSGFTADFFQPEEYTASTLPDVHLDYEYLCCPRIISDLSTKIGLGQIETKVRQILREAPFPVLIPSQVYKPWKSITVFFGGSESAKSALLFAASLAERAEVPCRIFTQDEGKGWESYADQIREQLGEAWSGEYEWKFFTQGSMRDNLFEVEHDTLAVMGIFGHPPLKKALFGSTMELIQSHLPNSLLLVGDKCCFPGG